MEIKHSAIASGAKLRFLLSNLEPQKAQSHKNLRKCLVPFVATGNFFQGALLAVKIAPGPLGTSCSPE
jgi:hypothetical protein